MNIQNFKGDWALVTGASSGIGREFCQQLAAQGLNLVLVARREARISQLAEELAARHGIAARAIPLDLAEREAPQQLKQTLDSEGIRVRLLVNNAASGHQGHFGDGELPDYQSMIALNTSAMVALCHCFVPHLCGFAGSAIINVSSQAAYQPVPYMAVYAASKAFVQSFSQALYGELQHQGIHIQTLVPGPTATEFDQKAGAYESAIKARGTPAEVVSRSLQKLQGEAPVVTNAKGVYQQKAFAALAPAKTVINTVAKMFKPPPKF